MKKLSYLIIILLSALFFTQGFAADSQASAFARQAGGLAGTAKACGQDVALFKSRAAEAIAVLAASKEDEAAAIKIFDQAAEEQEVNQTVLKNVACAEFLPDFAALPLLQDNYKNAVLAKLAVASPKPIDNAPLPKPKIVGDQLVNGQLEPTVASPAPQSN